MGLKKEQLLHLAETRLEDSRILFNGNRYDGTVYLSGYVIELALKAKVVEVHGFEFPEVPTEKEEDFTCNGKKLSKGKLWTHDLNRLAGYANFDTNSSNDIRAYWGQLSTCWNSEMRYSTSPNNDESKALALLVLESVCFLWSALK